MNIISKYKTTSKTLIVTGSLLIGLAITPIASIADNAKHESYSNKASHSGDRNQRDHRQNNNGHDDRGHYQHSNDRRDHREVHRFDHRDYHVHDHGDRHYSEVHYVVHDRPYYPRIIDRFGLEVGVHTGNFDIVFRD